MDKNKEKQLKRQRRHNRVRAKVQGTTECPRLSVFRSNTSINLQIIDDLSGKTLVSAHSRDIKDSKEKVEVSHKLGLLIAKKALEQKIEKVVFDRGGNKYHGRIKAVAEGAREGGLKF